MIAGVEIEIDIVDAGQGREGIRHRLDITCGAGGAHCLGQLRLLVDESGYVFFQLTRKGLIRRFKSYPREEFASHEHFQHMMMKYMTPSAFLNPPEPIAALTLAELDRVYEIVRQKALEI